MSDKTIDPAYIAAEIYEDFFVKAIFNHWTPLLIERALPLPGEQVLDVACGTGVAARAAVPLVGDQGKVTGLDKSSQMLSVACRKFSAYCDDIDWWEGAAENLPFPWHSFDLVLCQQGFQFFTDRSQAAREMRRVLRPGGRAAVAVWQGIEAHPLYHQVFTAISARMDAPLPALAAAFAFGDPRQLTEIFETAGFSAVRVESVTHAVHFAHPDRFLELTFQAAAAVVPIYARLDAQTQSAAFDALKNELAPVLAAHTRAGLLTFDMHANIAVAK